MEKIYPFKYSVHEEFQSRSFNILTPHFSAGYKTPVHWHDYFEIELVLRGEAYHCLNGDEYMVQRGDLYLLTPADFHQLRVETSCDVLHITLTESLMEEDFLTAFHEAKRTGDMRLSDEEIRRICFFGELLREERTDALMAEESVRSLFRCLFILLVRHLSESGVVIPEKESRSMKKGLLYLYDHFRENPDLQTIADCCGFSPNYFSTKFHETTGMTFKAYCNALKLNYAKKMLLSSNLSVTEICYASGFQTFSHFLREFRMRFGASPQELRKQYESQKNTMSDL